MWKGECSCGVLKVKVVEGRKDMKGLVRSRLRTHHMLTCSHLASIEAATIQIGVCAYACALSDYTTMCSHLETLSVICFR